MHTASIDSPPATPSTQPLLDIDAARFRASFDRKPFLIGHRLADHPLFSLARLIELSRTLPANHVEYNAGDIPVTVDPRNTPRTGLSIDETIRRIEERNSWMVLKFVEQDAAYRDLLHACLAEVKAHSESILPGMFRPEGFIFISSAGAVTPYHMDPEHNFLLQVRGTKNVVLLDGRDRAVLADEEVEAFYGRTHRNLEYRQALDAKALRFQLSPGQGLHFPVLFPHHIQVGPAYSISFSITFRTPDLDRRRALYLMNGLLRRRGWQPAPVGASAWRDAMKYQTFRALRRARWLPGESGAGQ